MSLDLLLFSLYGALVHFEIYSAALTRRDFRGHN